jgi:hypothetical protein
MIQNGVSAMVGMAEKTQYPQLWKTVKEYARESMTSYQEMSLREVDGVPIRSPE